MMVDRHLCAGRPGRPSGTGDRTLLVALPVTPATSVGGFTLLRAESLALQGRV